MGVGGRRLFLLPSSKACSPRSPAPAWSPSANCESHQLTPIFPTDDQARDRPEPWWAGPGGKAGGAQEKVPGNKAAVEHPQLGLSCLLLS